MMCYFHDRHVATDNDAAEQALRAVALGRKNYLFCGSDAGGERAAAIYNLGGTANLSGTRRLSLVYRREMLQVAPVRSVIEFVTELISNNRDLIRGQASPPPL